MNFIIYRRRLLIARPIQATATSGLNRSPIIEAFLMSPENPFSNDLILSGQILKRYVLKQIKSTISVIIDSKLKRAD